MLLSGLTFSQLYLLYTALDIGVRSVCRISYFVHGTWYIVLSNAERPVQNVEVGNSANGTIPYFVSRISYLAHCTSYKNEPFSPYLCIYSMGLTGFDSRCNHRARMQAGVCTALKNSCKRQMAKLLTPWLLNLT